LQLQLVSHRLAAFCRFRPLLVVVYSTVWTKSLSITLHCLKACSFPSIMPRPWNLSRCSKNIQFCLSFICPFSLCDECVLINLSVRTQKVADATPVLWSRFRKSYSVFRKKERKKLEGREREGPPPLLANGEENRIATFSNLSGCSLQFYVAQKFGLPSTFTL